MSRIFDKLRRDLAKKPTKKVLEQMYADAMDWAGSLQKGKDQAYSERNKVVVAFGKLAMQLGWKAYRAKHDPNDLAWESDWRNILVVETPKGQAAWHFHDSERDMLDGFVFNPDYVWDGHSTPEKYERLARI